MIDAAIGVLLVSAFAAFYLWGRERGRAEFRNGLRSYELDMNNERTIARSRKTRTGDWKNRQR